MSELGGHVSASVTSPLSCNVVVVDTSPTKDNGCLPLLRSVVSKPPPPISAVREGETFQGKPSVEGRPRVLSLAMQFLQTPPACGQCKDFN